MWVGSAAKKRIEHLADRLGVRGRVRVWVVRVRGQVEVRVGLE